MNKLYFTRDSIDILLYKSNIFFFFQIHFLKTESKTVDLLCFCFICGSMEKVYSIFFSMPLHQSEQESPWNFNNLEPSSSHNLRNISKIVLESNPQGRMNAVLSGTADGYDNFYLRFESMQSSLRGMEKHLLPKQLQTLQKYTNVMEQRGDFNVQVKGDGFLHFLVELYSGYIDMNEVSIMESIYEVIRTMVTLSEFDINPRGFDINLRDREGNTPLMKVESLYKKTEMKNEEWVTIISEKIERLRVLFEENGGVITWSNEQRATLETMG